MENGNRRAARSEWRVLNDAIRRVLNRYAGGDAVTLGVVWVSETHSPGWYLQAITLRDLSLLRPQLTADLQALLAQHPDWSIELLLAAPDQRSDWTDMIIEIAHDRIIDRLRHEALPDALRNVRFGITSDELRAVVEQRVRRLMQKRLPNDVRDLEGER